jgi:dihydropteroate synthase
VIEALRKRAIPAVISIDTSKPELMQRAIEAGAGLINDVCALTEPGAVEVVSQLQVPVCLMHMQGQPRTMQKDPQYDDVVRDVYNYLSARADTCVQGGIKKEQILIDPGFGFGKSVGHNLSLLKHLSTFAQMGLPLLVGLSRKSMMASILDKDVNNRLAGSIAAACFALAGGAVIIRAHDVDETMDAIKLYTAMSNAD